MDIVSYMQDDNDEGRCAICNKKESEITNLTSQSALQTNATPTCGHQFCHSCLGDQFLQRSEFLCPTGCGSIVKKSTLTYRTLDSVLCENDANWRRRVLKVFNKQQTDFDDLKSYNDYLEMVEDMIYSIVNEEPNADECKKRLKDEEQGEHKAAITQRQARKAEEERTILDQIEKERLDADRQKREMELEKQGIDQLKRKMKKEHQEVLLGQREEISAEALQAQMHGYATAVRLSRQGKQQTTIMQNPNVRQLPKHEVPSSANIPNLSHRRRAAGGGIRTANDININSTTTDHREIVQQRQWKETTSSLFEHLY